MNSLHRIVPLVLAALLAGCAKAPVKELSAYGEAFSSGAATGDTLYLDAAAVLAELDAAQQPAPAVPASPLSADNPPVEFIPPAPVAATAATAPIPDEIALRLQAIEAVRAYNAALTAKLSGDPLDAVTKPLGAAGQSLLDLAGLVETVPDELLGLGNLTGKLTGVVVKLNPFTAMAPGVLEGLKGLARAALAARTAEEVNASIVASHASIQQILDVLEADTRHLYGFQKIRCQLRRLEAVETSATRYLRPLARTAAAFERPVPGSAQHAALAGLEQRMTAAAAELYRPGLDFAPCGEARTLNTSTATLAFTIGSYPYTFPFRSGGARLVEDNVTALGEFVSEYERRAASAVQASTALRDYHRQVLPAYVASVRATKAGLGALHAAAVQPDPGLDLGRIIEVGTVIRSNLERIRGGLRSNAAPAPP